LGRRQAAADKNRRRVIAAARALLARQRGGELSIEAIAKRAGVTRMTVYLQFKSKGGLLRALFDDLAAQGGMARMPEAFALRDPQEGLKRAIVTLVAFWASNPIVLRRVRNLADTDAELEAAVRERDGWRRQAMRVLASRLSSQTTGQVSLEDATDALHALTSFETFDTLTQAGRTPPEVAAIVGRVAFGPLG
jgi:AcrR family transcriptional regulator